MKVLEWNDNYAMITCFIISGNVNKKRCVDGVCKCPCHEVDE